MAGNALALALCLGGGLYLLLVSAKSKTAFYLSALGTTKHVIYRYSTNPVMFTTGTNLGPIGEMCVIFMLLAQRYHAGELQI